MTPIRTRLWLGLLVLVYTAILVWVYATNVVPNFSYMGFEWYAPTAWACCVMAVLALTPLSLLPIEFEAPSDFLLWILYLATVIPAVSIPMVAFRTGYMLASSSAVLMLSFCFACVLARVHVRLDRIRTMAMQPRAYWSLVGLLTATLFVLMVSTFGINFQASLATAYDIRSEYKGKLESDGFAAYAMGLLSNCLLPILMAGALRYGRWSFALLLVAGQVILFSATGNKSVLFSGILVAAAYFLLSRKSLRATSLLLGLIAGLVFLISLGEMTGSPWPVSVGVRRLFIVPGYLTGAYMDYFGVMQNILYSKSFLKEFAVYPELTDYRYVIGGIYQRSTQMYANGNLWADAYANMGLIGLPFVAVGLGVFLALMNSVSGHGNRYRMAFIAAALSVASFALANSGFFTTLMSHGLAAAFLLVMFAPTTANDT